MASFVATSATACRPCPLAASRRGGGSSRRSVVTSSTVPTLSTRAVSAVTTAAASSSEQRGGGSGEAGVVTATSSWRRTAAAVAAGCYLTAATTTGALMMPPPAQATFMEELQQPSVMNLKLKERTQEAGGAGETVPAFASSRRILTHALDPYCTCKRKTAEAVFPFFSKHPVKSVIYKTFSTEEPADTPTLPVCLMSSSSSREDPGREVILESKAEHIKEDFSHQDLVGAIYAEVVVGTFHRVILQNTSQNRVHVTNMTPRSECNPTRRATCGGPTLAARTSAPPSSAAR
jgi:hypothetical protein